MEKSYIIRNSFMQDVYDTMQGVFESDVLVAGVEPAFTVGKKCEQLYGQVYDAERRLEERLGVSGHDPDVECIIRAMTDIQEELCFRMYYYGAKFGMRDERT